MKKHEIEGLREKYTKDVLHEADIDKDPFIQFKNWFNVAVETQCLEPNAMTLATVGIDHIPSARTVLYKGLSERRGITFYTNYGSKKAIDIKGNPFASLLFCWLPLARQVRMQGRIVKLSKAESEAYFHKRPRGSQIGAWVSEQSSTIESRQVLEGKLKEVEARFADLETIPLPENWGGYELIPTQFEFWQGNDNRLHDRFLFELVDGQWVMSRLAP